MSAMLVFGECGYADASLDTLGTAMSGKVTAVCATSATILVRLQRESRRRLATPSSKRPSSSIVSSVVDEICER